MIRPLALVETAVPRVLGYLVEPDAHEIRRDAPALLAVVCVPCDRWHMHPAGTARQRLYAAGDVTSRRGCDSYPDGYDVVVQRTPMRDSWFSPTMRITSAYRPPAEFLLAASLSTSTTDEQEKAA